MEVFDDESGTGREFLLDTVDTPQSRRVESTLLVDLRGSPRIEVSLPVEIFPQVGERILAMVTNLSRTGLQVEADSKLVGSLFAGRVLQDKHISALARFSFRVPDATGGDSPVEVWGRTVYARQDGGGYKVGVEIRNFSSGHDALFDYLASRGIHQ